MLSAPLQRRTFWRLFSGGEQKPVMKSLLIVDWCWKGSPTCLACNEAWQFHMKRVWARKRRKQLLGGPCSHKCLFVYYTTGWFESLPSLGIHSHITGHVFVCLGSRLLNDCLLISINFYLLCSLKVFFFPLSYFTVAQHSILYFTSKAGDELNTQTCRRY